MNLARSTELAVTTLCHYVPEDSQEVRLALATFDAIRQAMNDAEVKSISDLRRRLGVKLPPADRDAELGDLF